MDATVTRRPADATWYSVKPSKLTVGTSVRPFATIIDHDIEEEDHHHGLAAGRDRSIVAEETGGRTGLFASSWNKRIVSLRQQ
jgi:hypothetical protein